MESQTTTGPLVPEEGLEEEIAVPGSILRLVLDNMDEWVLLMDQSKRVVWANNSVGAALGVQPGRLEGRQCWSIFEKHTNECTDCALSQVSENAFPHQFEIRPSRGGARLVTCYQVNSEEGDSFGYLFVAKDITQLALAEQEKAARVKLEGVLEMAGSAAHELSQPLQALLTNLELLTMELQQNAGPLSPRIPQLDEHLTRVSKVVHKLQTVTRYKTMDYMGKSKIVDLDLASALDTDKSK